MSLTTLSWRLEDFNSDAESPKCEFASDPATDDSTSVDEEREVDTWTDGYLQAARHTTATALDVGPKGDLTVALHKLESDLRESADAATMIVAHLLVSATAAVCCNRWSSGLSERVQRLAEMIKPALLSATPELSLRSDNGDILLTTSCLDDLAERQIELGFLDSATLSWKLGSAECSRKTAMRDMAWALAPLIVDVIEPDTNLKP